MAVSPRQVVEAYWKLAEKDPSEATNQHFTNQWSGVLLTKRNVLWWAQQIQEGLASLLRIEQEHVGQNNALVVVQVLDKHGRESSLRLDLSRIRGEWKIFAIYGFKTLLTDDETFQQLEPSLAGKECFGGNHGKKHDTDLLQTALERWEKATIPTMGERIFGVPVFSAEGLSSLSNNEQFSADLNQHLAQVFRFIAMVEMRMAHGEKVGACYANLAAPFLAKANSSTIKTLTTKQYLTVNGNTLTLSQQEAKEMVNAINLMLSTYQAALARAAIEAANPR